VIGIARNTHITRKRPATDKRSLQIVYLDRMLRGGLDLLGATSSQLQNLTGAFRSAARIAQEGLDQYWRARTPGPAATNVREVTAQPDNPAAATPFVLSGAQSALNLLGLLATESHYYGRSVTIEEEPFLLELSAQLRELPNVTVYHPALFTPWSEKASFEMPFAIQADFDAVMAARNHALRPVKRLLMESAALKPDDPLYLEMRFASDQSREQYEAADALLRELNTRLSTRDDAIGATGFQMMVRAAAMVKIFAQEDKLTYLLFARMEAAGGAYRVVRSLARLVFGGDGIDYAAGVIVSFGLFDLDGRLLESGILTCRNTFRSVEKPEFWRDVLPPVLMLIGLTAALAWLCVPKT
jgi:hypothetical protein